MDGNDRPPPVRVAQEVVAASAADGLETCGMENRYELLAGQSGSTGHPASLSF